jgi:lipoprotein-releasing system permease protein
MSEIDSNIIYMDLADMQRLRTMENRATSLQLKLKDYDRDKQEVVAKLSKTFDDTYYMVSTWEEKQGTLLAAIAIERGLLNVLLFLIIAVAGFGILAIFFMIVVEKMRDIGILKALGASNGGVMGIFLTYGLALGLVGAGLGTLLGLTITIYINEIELGLSRLTGNDVFDRSIYYFDKIPTDIQPGNLLLLNLGAIGIAVAASVLPAFRAALMHPVQALRYE